MLRVYEKEVAVELNELGNHVIESLGANKDEVSVKIRGLIERTYPEKIAHSVVGRTTNKLGDELAYVFAVDKKDLEDKGLFTNVASTEMPVVVFNETKETIEGLHKAVSYTYQKRIKTRTLL